MVKNCKIRVSPRSFPPCTILPHLIIILLQIFRYHAFMPCECLFKVGKGIAGDSKGGLLNMIRESIKSLRVEQLLGQYFMTQHFSQDHTGIECHFGILIAAKTKSQSMIEAIAGKTHPFNAVKRTSGLLERYSTVGHLVPICRLSRLLKICETSFFACNEVYT